MKIKSIIKFNKKGCSLIGKNSALSRRQTMGSNPIYPQIIFNSYKKNFLNKH